MAGLWNLTNTTLLRLQPVSFAQNEASTIVAYFILVVGSGGILLNIFGICFLTLKLKNKTTFSNLLLVLAIMDTLYLVSTILCFILGIVIEEYNEYVTPYIYPYLYPIVWTSLMSSVNLTISLALERYLAIVKPLLREKYLFLKRASTFANPSIIISILFHLVTWFWYQTTYIYCKVNITTNKYNQTYQVCSWTLQPVQPEETWVFYRADYESTEFEQTWIKTEPILNLLFGTLLPLITITTLSILLHNGLKRQRIASTGGDSVQLKHTEQRMGRIGFVIIIIFILCHSLRAIESSLRVFFNYTTNGDVSYNSKFAIIVACVYPLLIVNSSVNFLVYFLHSGRVKETLASFMMHKSNNHLITNNSLPLAVQFSQYQQTTRRQFYVKFT